MKQIMLSQEQINKAENILDKYREGVDFSTLKNKNSEERYKPYESFCNGNNRKDAYEFSKILGVSVCPYCNEQYIFTVLQKNGNTITRPEFDHFIPKSISPELQLTLKNLVPSCHICNSTLKGQKKFSNKTHLNPYEKDFNSIIKISIDINENLNYLDENSFNIIFVFKDLSNPDNELANANIDVFKLKERYQNHKDEVVKILKLANLYNNAKKLEIENILSESNKQTLPIKNILFPDANCNINKTSLGKLKRDIIDEFVK